MTELQQRTIETLQRDPTLDAIAFEDRWYTWGDIERVASSVGAALTASGIGPRAPVAFIPRNRPAAFAALLGLIAQGRTIQMIYAFQSPTGIAAAIEKIEPAAIVAHREDFTPEVRESLSRAGIAAVALDAMEASALAGFETAGDAASRIATGEPRIDILTSGTTGPPKQFAVSYRLIEQYFLSSALTARQGDGPESLPPFLLYFPLGNISGLYSTLPMLIRGQRVVLLERFSIPAWRDYVVRHRPAHSGLPPSCVQLVLDENIPKEDLASIRSLGVGAAPLDANVQKAFEDRYGIPILLSYGATEFAGPVAAMTPELHAEWGRTKIGTVGRAMPGARLRVVDPDSGAELSAGSEGLLEVVSPRIGPDWIRTSDLAVIDEDGFLFHRGRADGAIMRGGFKILPEPVERALMLHPAVSEAVVVGIPDRRLGEIPVAAIRLKPDEPAPGAEALELHVRQHVLATNVPARWLFCADLPRTPSLKLDRPAVARLFQAAPG